LLRVSISIALNKTKLLDFSIKLILIFVSITIMLRLFILTNQINIVEKKKKIVYFWQVFPLNRIILLHYGKGITPMEPFCSALGKMISSIEHFCSIYGNESVSIIVMLTSIRIILMEKCSYFVKSNVNAAILVKLH